MFVSKCVQKICIFEMPIVMIFMVKEYLRKKQLKIIINVWKKKKTRPTFVELNKVGADFDKNICNMYDTLYDIILK